MSTDRQQLAEYQATLLELLSKYDTIDEIQSHLRTDAPLALYRHHAESFEPRMIEVAAELTKRWGRRK